MISRACVFVQPWWPQQLLHSQHHSFLLYSRNLSHVLQIYFIFFLIFIRPKYTCGQDFLISLTGKGFWNFTDLVSRYILKKLALLLLLLATGVFNFQPKLLPSHCSKIGKAFYQLFTKSWARVGWAGYCRLTKPLVPPKLGSLPEQEAKRYIISSDDQKFSL